MNGQYYALMSRKRYEALPSTAIPENLRSDLQRVCLDIRAIGFEEPIAQILKNLLNPLALLK